MEYVVDYNRVDMPRYIIPGALGFSVVAAAFLFWLIYGREASTGYDVGFLSAVNASLNAASAVSLFAGLAAIRKGNWKTPRT